MNVKFVAGLIVAFTVLGCATSSEVPYEYAKNVNFKELKLYTWKPIAENRYLDESTIAHIQRSIDAEMNVKGLQRSSAEADFLVETSFRSKVRKRGSARHNPREGFLSIHFKDPNTGAQIWCGMTRILWEDISSPEQVVEIIDSAVKRILTNFPPSN